MSYSQKKLIRLAVLIVGVAAVIGSVALGVSFYNNYINKGDVSVANFYYSFVGPFSLPNTLIQGKSYTFTMTCQNNTANTIPQAGVQVDARRTSGGAVIGYTFVSMSPSGTVTPIAKTGYTSYQVLDGAVAPGQSVTYTITMAPPAGENAGDYFNFGYLCSYGEQGWLTGYSYSLKVAADPNAPSSSSSSSASSSSSSSSSSSATSTSSSVSASSSVSSSKSSSKTSSSKASSSSSSASSVASSSSSSVASSADTAGNAELKFDTTAKSTTTSDSSTVIVNGTSKNINVPVDVYINDNLVLSKFDLDKDGKFSLELHLVAGVNTVKVTATQSGATLDDTIEINYTTVADNTPIIVLVVAIGMLLLTFAIEEVRFGVIRHKLSSSQKVV